MLVLSAMSAYYSVYQESHGTLEFALSFCQPWMLTSSILIIKHWECGVKPAFQPSCQFAPGCLLIDIADSIFLAPNRL